MTATPAGNGSICMARPSIQRRFYRAHGALPAPRVQTGYTIVELMIVVAIVSVIAMVALPNMNYAMQNSRVRTATTDTLTTLLLARSEAIKRNSNISVVRSGASWLNGWSVRSGTTDLTVQDPLSGITVECYIDTTASTNCGNTLTFERTGRASSYIEFRIYHGDNLEVPMRCVRVSLSGRPGITLDTNSDPTDGCA